MTNTAQGHVDTYLERIKGFYSKAQMWVRPLSTRHREVEVLEQESGLYTAPCLIMTKSDGSEVARLEPAGTWILGAEGRIDLKGSHGKEVIVFLMSGGPVLNFKESVGDEEISRSSVTLFQGVDHDGWYWIEDSRRGRAKPVTQELFRDLVSEVSDYAFE